MGKLDISHYTCTLNKALEVYKLIFKHMPEVIKLFTCSTHLSTKFQQIIKTKLPTNTEVSLRLSDFVFIMPINVKMPTIVDILIVDILTFISRINSVLS